MTRREQSSAVASFLENEVLGLPSKPGNEFVVQKGFDIVLTDPWERYIATLILEIPALGWQAEEQLQVADSLPKSLQKKKKKQAAGPPAKNEQWFFKLEKASEKDR